MVKKEYYKAQEIVKRILQEYPNEKRLAEAYNQASLLWIEQDIDQNKLVDARIKIHNLDIPVRQSQDGKKIRTMYYIKLTEKFVQESNFANAISLLQKARLQENDIQNDLDKLLLQNYNKWALDYIEEKKYAEAVDLLNISRNYFPDDNVIINNLRFAYLKWADREYKGQGNEQERLAETIKILQLAIENLGNDYKILTNIEFYVNNTAAKAVQKNELQKALAILKTGLEMYPSSAVLNKNFSIIQGKLQ